MEYPPRMALGLQQETELTGSSSASPDALVDVDVNNLLFAGKSILDPDIGSYFTILIGFLP